MDHHLGVGASGTTDSFRDKYYVGRRPNGFYIPRFRNLVQAPRFQSLFVGMDIKAEALVVIGQKILENINMGEPLMRPSLNLVDGL